MSEEQEISSHSEEEILIREKTSRYHFIKCTFLFLLIVLILAMLFTPTVLKSAKKMDLTQAISNSKQIYLVLLDFESDMGSFPDDRTAAKDAVLSSFRGNYSNDYLGQLIAGGYTKSEEIFYALDKRYKNRRPDDYIDPSAEILKKNECGFSYVLVDDKGQRRGLSTTDNGGIPILLAPLLNEWGSIETTTFEGRGVYLRVDGSARSERLRPADQKIKLAGGVSLLESGPATVWGDLKPVVLLPER